MVKICTVSYVVQTLLAHHEDSEQLVLDALLRGIRFEVGEPNE